MNINIKLISQIRNFSTNNKMSIINGIIEANIYNIVTAISETI